MNKCQSCKGMMMEALYGELGPGERELFDEHLGDCPDCASEYCVLGATLEVMGRRRRSDPGEAFWEGYWNRLVARMERTAGEVKERPSFRLRLGRFFSSLPRWSYQAAAAAALLAVGILIGRSLFRPSGLGGTMEQGMERVGVINAASDPVIRAGNLLERSKVLLLGMVNFDPKTQDLYALDLDRKKAVSRELVSQAADIRGRLTDPRQRKLRELVADLEIILVQIANLGAGNDLDGVELVKQGVEQKSLFLKIDLTRMAGSGPVSQKPAVRPAGRLKI